MNNPVQYIQYKFMGLEYGLLALLYEEEIAAGIY